MCTRFLPCACLSPRGPETGLPSDISYKLADVQVPTALWGHHKTALRPLRCSRFYLQHFLPPREGVMLEISPTDSPFSYSLLQFPFYVSFSLYKLVVDPLVLTFFLVYTLIIPAFPSLSVIPWQFRIIRSSIFPDPVSSRTVEDLRCQHIFHAISFEQKCPALADVLKNISGGAFGWRSLSRTLHRCHCWRFSNDLFIIRVLSTVRQSDYYLIPNGFLSLRDLGISLF